MCGSVRNTQNFIHDEISDSENIGEVINANDHDTDNYVDEGDDCNYATDFTDLVESDQVDDLIDLEDDDVRDELDFNQIDGVDNDVEQFLFQSSEQDEANSEVVENWVLVHEPIVVDNEDSVFTDETDILFAAEVEQGIDVLLSNFDDDDDVEIFYSDTSSTFSEALLEELDHDITTDSFNETDNYFEINIENINYQGELDSNFDYFF